MQRRKMVWATLTLALAIAPMAHGAGKPSPDEASKVMDYYYSDASEPLLVDFKLCESVHQEGDEKHNCKNEIDRGQVEAGSEVYLWMKYLVPREASATVLTQLNHDGITRRTYRRELDGALRYRTWHTTQFKDTGKWEVSIFHEASDGVRKLFSTVLKVQ